MEVIYSKPGDAESIVSTANQLIKAIIGRFNLSIVQPEQVKIDCDQLGALYKKAISESVSINLEPLYPLLQKRSGPVAEHLFVLLSTVAMDQSNVQPLVEAMISARDKSIAIRALQVALLLVESGSLKVNQSFIQFIATRVEADTSTYGEAETVRIVSQIVKHLKPGSRFHQKDPILALYLEDNNLELRCLAARILDLESSAVSHNLMESVLGVEMAEFFAPYFDFTNTRHLDLLSLEPGAMESLRNDFILAKEVLGEKLLCDIISSTGWDRLNLGIQVQALAGVSVGDSLPYMVPEYEATLLKKCGLTDQISKQYLIVACGGQISNEQHSDTENDPITRFRSYNLNHASLLSDFLDIGPLSVEKVWDIIKRMDQIVEDYVALFKHFSDECSILPGVYQKIRKKVTNELNGNVHQPQFSADLTRLVQSFEEPRSVGGVRTLHGLKRYLHQTGLTMGFKLAIGGRSPNRTIDILIATDEGIKYSFRKIRFADFEPHIHGESKTPQIPYTVKLLIDGFTRQMLHGQEQFPGVDIFCYGNEVHYYFGFRNHPAFLRIDYAPPLRGGMIDLEYFGVSNYQLDQHPNVSLDAIKAFFQRIEFEIRIQGVRIHARYDKERALTLGDLCDKACQLFRLAPYFMDLDWVIGSLDIEKKARQKVAEAWIEYFLHWGFLPLKSVLTKNRTGILCGYVNGPTGQIEKVWSGEGKYTDIFTGCPPAGFYSNLINVFRGLGLEIPVPSGKESKMHPGQLDIEKRVLSPLRLAIKRGELLLTSDGLKIESPALFTRVHEAEVFAELLTSGLDEIAGAIATARLVRPMERSIKFNTTGDVNGYNVQTAVLGLRGEKISFFVLRGAKEMIRLAFFTRDRVVYKSRSGASARWISNVNYNVIDLAELLKANDFIDTLPKINFASDQQKASVFLDEINHSALPSGKAPLRGDRVVMGLKASPGYTVGKVLFGTEGRNPQDFRGSILVATSIRPEDTTFLYYANGIISTGGGILSHAGLIAMQFRKPALIITGKWQTDANGRDVLILKSIDYKIIHKSVTGYRVSIRTDIQEKEYSVREGDLLILDSRSGNLRILGQDNNILALYEGFRLYNSANEALSIVNGEMDILFLRGRLLRARHQLENVLRRCSDPVIARYAIFEIMLNGPESGINMRSADKFYLLSVLLKNRNSSDEAREYLMQIMIDLGSSFAESVHKAFNDMPSSQYVFEILYLRLDIIHQMHAVESARKALLACDIEYPHLENFNQDQLESLVHSRLAYLKRKLLEQIRYIADKRADDYRLRHLIRQVDRINGIFPVSNRRSLVINSAREKMADIDSVKCENFSNHLIIESKNCGFELYNYIGWKAANLAEIERLGKEDLVPPWFVVTDLAFSQMMQTPIKEIDLGIGYQLDSSLTLREAIANILGRKDLGNLQKSIQIRALWDRIRLPDELSEEVIKAYKKITAELTAKNQHGKQADVVYVAVRSSSLEEDTEAAAHAGEFETYLYIRGDDQILHYLKRTWSGLWTERAIHNRALLGGEDNLKGGGVIVQRMVNSRVSGVLQTVNIPKGNIREMVINAGLGLGEGVVSGIVAADQVTVTKGVDPEKELLRFSYITSDKTYQIIFNQHAGFGTIRSQTIYHQRLRPAMEYVELCQLVRNAAALEKAYGYPLDIEFGIEEDHLWILQARPVASFLTVHNETTERYPLRGYTQISGKE
jgi:phosphohistidine swiveling domain-containing protein